MRKILFILFMTGFLAKPVLAQIPDFTMTDCNGVSHHLYDDLAAGNAVVMKFCAGWCGPCAISNPLYESVWKEYSQGNCKVKMYNMLFETNTPGEATDCEFAAQYVDHYNMTMPVFANFGAWRDGLMAQFADYYNIEAIPTTVIILPNQQDPANSTVKIIVGTGEFDEQGNGVYLDQLLRDKLESGGFYSSRINVIGDLCANPPYSLTLSSNSATGNLWSTGATTQSIVINQPGTYSLSVGTPGCSNAKTIEFVPIPVVGTASSSSTTICQDGEITLNYSLPQGSPDDLMWVSRGAGESEWDELFANPNDGPFTFRTSNYFLAGSSLEFAVRARSSNGACTEFSNIVTVTVTDVQAGTLPGTASGPTNPVCVGSDYTLNYTGGVEGAYWVYYNIWYETWEYLGSAGQPLNPNGLIDLNHLGYDRFKVRYFDGECYANSEIIQVNYHSQGLQITGPSLICPGSSASLELNGNYSNILWSTTATISSITVTPPVTATYNVTATDAYGCTYSDEHTVEVEQKITPIVQSTSPGTVCGSGEVTLSFGGINMGTACAISTYGQWPENVFTFSSCDANNEEITNEGYLGEYSMVNVEAGKYYGFFSYYTNGSGEIINTVTNADGSQVLVTGAIWKATFSGQVRFYTHGPGCAADNTFFITRYAICFNDPSIAGTFLWMPGGQTTPSITVNPATTTNYTLTYTLIGQNCSASTTKQVIAGIGAVELSTTNVTCNSATLNWSTPFNPTQWELEYKSTSQGSKWISVPVANVSARSATITGLKFNQNYQWHIKAKCGKSRTPYSDLVLFKTLASCAPSLTQNRSVNNATPENEVIDMADELKVVAMPNPSKTNFKVAIGGVDNLKEPVRITVSDMLGRVVETRTVTAGQVILIGDKYRSGTYLLRLTQGNKVNQLKLVKVSD